MVRKQGVTRRWKVPARSVIWVGGKKVVLPRKPRRVNVRWAKATSKDVEQFARQRARERSRSR